MTFHSEPLSEVGCNGFHVGFSNASRRSVERGAARYRSEVGSRDDDTQSASTTAPSPGLSSTDEIFDLPVTESVRALSATFPEVRLPSRRNLTSKRERGTSFRCSVTHGSCSDSEYPLGIVRHFETGESLHLDVELANPLKHDKRVIGPSLRASRRQAELARFSWTVRASLPRLMPSSCSRAGLSQLSTRMRQRVGRRPRCKRLPPRPWSGEHPNRRVYRFLRFHELIRDWTFAYACPTSQSRLRLERQATREGARPSALTGYSAIHDSTCFCSAGEHSPAMNRSSIFPTFEGCSCGYNPPRRIPTPEHCELLVDSNSYR